MTLHNVLDEVFSITWCPEWSVFYLFLVECFLCPWWSVFYHMISLMRFSTIWCPWWSVFYHMMSLMRFSITWCLWQSVFYLSLTKCFLLQDILDEVFFTTWCPWWSVFYHMMSLMRFSITWCPWWSIFYLSLTKCFLSHDVLDEVISIMSLVKHLLSACLTSQETMLEFWLLMQTLNKQRCRKRAFLVGSIPLQNLFLWSSCVSAAQKGLKTNRGTSPLRKTTQCWPLFLEAAAVPQGAVVGAACSGSLAVAGSGCGTSAGDAGPRASESFSPGGWRRSKTRRWGRGSYGLQSPPRDSSWSSAPLAVPAQRQARQQVPSQPGEHRHRAEKHW